MSLKENDVFEESIRESCDICEGTGIVTEGEHDNIQEKRCLCVEKARAEFEGEALSDMQREDEHESS